MVSVKRYYCALSGEQVGPKTTPVVLASDYDALAAQSERLWEFVRAVHSGGVNQEFKTWASELLRARAADSAKETP